MLETVITLAIISLVFLMIIFMIYIWFRTRGFL